MDLVRLTHPRIRAILGMALTQDDIQIFRDLIRGEVGDRLDRMDYRFDKLESKVESMDTRITGLQVETQLTREALETLSAKTDQRFDALQTSIDGLYKQDETRQQEYIVMRSQIERLEKKCA